VATLQTMFSPSRPVNRRTFDPMCAETGFGPEIPPNLPVATPSWDGCGTKSRVPIRARSRNAPKSTVSKP